VSIEFSGKVKEERALFIVIPLLLLHLILISLQVEHPGGSLLFRNWVLLASAPFLEVSASIHRAAAYAWTNYLVLRGARTQNDLLQKRLEQLTFREDALRQMEVENVRLRQLLSLKETVPLETVGARVVGRVPDYLANIVYIDRGADDGVKANAPVLAATAVVGRTILVSRFNSQVQLITNTYASLGVMVERTRSPGVLSGSGQPLLSLDYINNSEQVEPDDVVVTSGLDGLFPKGLRIGRVVQSQRGKSAFRVIRVEPFADLLRLEEVLVLLTGSVGESR
jgi:rod shape-determining protein MreC